MDNIKDITLKIKAKAMSLGFSACGIAQAKEVDKSISNTYYQWIKEEKHAKMNYLSNYLDKKFDPRLLIENAKSIICLALNYYPTHFIPQNEYQIAYYAYGKDYHDIVKAKLRALDSYISELLPQSNHRKICSDTAPVLERYWAQQAGIGWIGKNTQLIIPHSGSYYFLAELILDIPLIYDSPSKNRCGSCSKCIDNCPTKALESPYHIDANHCISYLTIENREEIPSRYHHQLKDNMYGCDICQKVCPWNRFAQPTEEESFFISNDLLNMEKKDWKELTVERYRTLFKGSAVKRAKFEGIKRNINALK